MYPPCDETVTESQCGWNRTERQVWERSETISSIPTMYRSNLKSHMCFKRTHMTRSIFIKKLK